jgi:hypothetical protein
MVVKVEILLATWHAQEIFNQVSRDVGKAMGLKKHRRQ